MVDVSNRAISLETTKAAPEGADTRAGRLVGVGDHLGLIVIALALGYWNVLILRDFIGWLAGSYIDGWFHNDWWILTHVDPLHPYATPYNWSVPAAWIWAWVVIPIGPAIWTFLHFAALATLPFRVIALALVTVPFWADAFGGNNVTFAFVLAWHALNGSTWASVGFAVFAALVPRPIMVPVLVWLLWRRADARVAFAVGSVAVIGAGLATGTLGAYLSRIFGTVSPEWMGAAWNIGPSSVLGNAWIPIGLTLGAYATWKGRLGVASILVAPYLIHYYALFLLLELHPRIGNGLLGRPREIGLTFPRPTAPAFPRT